MKRGLYLGYNAKPWQTIYQESAIQQHELGAFFDDENGHIYRYAKNAAAGALVAGSIVQNATLGGAVTTLQGTCAVAVATVPSDLRVYVTRITTDQAADLYTEGWAAIWDNDLTAVYTRRVKYNAAIVAASTGYIDLYEPLPVALTTGDKVALNVNPFKDIIVAPVTATGMILGGVHCAVTASYFAWVQTKGWFGFRIKDVTTNIGAGPAVRAGTTAGSLITGAEVDSLGAYKQVIGMSSALWLDEYAGICYLMCE